MKNLPTEIINLILMNIVDKSSSTVAGWSCDALAASMVCKTWYNVGLQFFGLYLDNQEHNKNDPRMGARMYSSNYDSLDGVLCLQELKKPDTHLIRLIQLLSESERNNLCFHRCIHKLEINLHVLRNSLQGTNRAYFGQSYISLLQQLFEHCPRLRHLDILYNASSEAHRTEDKNALECSMRREVQSIACALSPFLASKRRNSFNRLSLTAGNRVRKRCPCCIGLKWDHLLKPLWQMAPARTMVLDQIIPTKGVFATFDKRNSLSHLILRRILLTVPRRRAMTNDFLGIPDQTWSGIKELEIDENLDDGEDTNNHLTEMGRRIHSLSRFVLQFCPSKPSLQGTQLSIDDVEDQQRSCINDILGLIRQHTNTLESIILCNIPHANSKMVHSLLKELPSMQVEQNAFTRIMLFKGNS